MDASFNSNDFVVVLGSGNSVNNLTDFERETLNKFKVKIGINKYSAFYNVSGIEPTHVFFQDYYDKTAKFYLQYIFKYLRKNNLSQITFIVSPILKGCLSDNYIAYIYQKNKKILINFFNKLFTKIFYTPIKNKKELAKRILNKIDNIFKSSDVESTFLLPKKSKIHYCDKQNWISKGNKWATDLKMPLFHFRGSFTSLLNYISIEYPKKKILLVGVDFNSSGYFFEKEMKKLNIDSSDWTTEISKNNNKHFSIIDYKGTKMDDEMPFILNNLEKSNNQMFSLNKNSYLVKNKFAKILPKDYLYKLKINQP